MKFVKKVVRSGKKAVKSRYGIGKGRKLNVARIASDVAKLAMVINSEKKQYQLALQSQNVGGCNANLTGSICLDVTPMMAQGADQYQRNGISIKLTSQFWQIQVSQMPSTVITNSIIYELWYNTGHVMDQSTALTSIYAPSIFSGVIDATSTRDADHMNDFRLLTRKRLVISADSVSGVGNVKTFTIPIKFNKGKGHHIRYTGTGYTNYLNDVQSGQILLVMRGDNGNSSTTTASTLPGYPTGANTGLHIRFANKTWYYDN